MSDLAPPSQPGGNALAAELRQLIDSARPRAAAAVNAALTLLYSQAGEAHSPGNPWQPAREGYGEQIVVSLARQLRPSMVEGGAKSNCGIVSARRRKDEANLSLRRGDN